MDDPQSLSRRVFADANDVLAHYRRVAPLWMPRFGRTPLVAAAYPDGFAAAPIYIASITAEQASTIETVHVQTHSGAHLYAALNEANVERYATNGAIEFHTWSPKPTDALQPAFGRVVFTPFGRATESSAKAAALAFRALLGEQNLKAIAMLDGFSGVAVWIPFDCAPFDCASSARSALGDTAYDEMRASLHVQIGELARRHPTLVTTAPLAERGDRIFTSAASNAPGHWSALPYSLRGVDGLPAVTPLRWDELGTFANGDVTASTLARRLETSGDVFASEVAAIGPQVFPATSSSQRTFALAGPRHDFAPRGRVIAAALAVLGDGKPRSADELLEASIAQGLLPKTTTRKYVYSSLIEYVARAKGRDRKPLIVQDPDRRFRVNHPADDWPAPKHAGVPAPPDNSDLIKRLEQTSAGDPEAFELTVCEAFTALGFRATHVGGPAAPDGYIDATLGALGYRVMLECKTGAKIVTQPDAFEAAKYRDSFNAQYATLIGPAFGDDVALASELKTHAVSAWSVDDLAMLLQSGSNAFEMRQLFEPGFAAERLPDVLWERDHGVRKRVAVACDILLEVGKAEQAADAERGAPDAAPLLNEDAAMMLIDHELTRLGVAQPCTREIVRAAFDYLTNPRILLAVWVDEHRSGIVVL